MPFASVLPVKAKGSLKVLKTWIGMTRTPLDRLRRIDREAERSSNLRGQERASRSTLPLHARWHRRAGGSQETVAGMGRCRARKVQFRLQHRRCQIPPSHSEAPQLPRRALRDHGVRAACEPLCFSDGPYRADVAAAAK